MTALGLRERKKLQARQLIQNEAMRLFLERGFESTTVDQIAQAAGVSSATVYRYYSSKEELVLGDDYDPIVEQAFADRPIGEPLSDTLRNVIVETLCEHIEINEELHVSRMTLIRQTPSLMPALYEEHQRTQAFICGLIARHLDREADDFDVRMAGSAVTALVHEAFHYWMDHLGTPRDQTPDLRELFHRALAKCESAMVS
jgi:AcrR family transcriptional regulator